MALSPFSPYMRAGLRRYTLAVILLVAVSIARVSPANAAAPLVLAVSAVSMNLPIFVAETEDYFTKEGVTVRIDEVASSVHGMKMLAEGKTDLTTGSETLVMFNSFVRNDFAILATFGTSTQDQKVIVHAQSGINNPKQLANKRVGTILGSSSHYYIDTFALLNGVDPKSITLVDYPPDTIVAALARREVDAISIWQPQAYRATQDIAGARVLADADFFTQRYNLIASRAVIGARADDLTRLLRALDRAIQFIATEPTKVRAILRTRLKVDAAYADWLLPRYRFRLALDQSLLTSLEGEARWAREEGHVSAPRSPNYLAFIHSAPLARVRPAAVGITQ